MKFWIDTTDGETVETFEASGHVDSNTSCHLDALKCASAWGYHKYAGYRLVTEDGSILDIVDPYKTEQWKRQMAFEHGALVEREKS